MRLRLLSHSGDQTVGIMERERGEGYRRRQEVERMVKTERRRLLLIFLLVLRYGEHFHEIESDEVREDADSLRVRRGTEDWIGPNAMRVVSCLLQLQLLPFCLLILVIGAGVNGRGDSRLLRAALLV